MMRAFLSHSSKDKTFVTSVANKLGRQFCVMDCLTISRVLRGFLLHFRLSIVASMVVLLAITSCAPMGSRYYIRQGYNPGEGHYEFIISHNKTKSLAYSIAENWIAKNYKSANTIIQQRDRENGVLVVRAITPFSVANFNFDQNYVYYTMEVRVKDNKSKISFDLGGVTGPSGGIREHPGTAPPLYQMDRIISAFENIKYNLSIAWSEQYKQDDF